MLTAGARALNFLRGGAAAQSVRGARASRSVRAPSARSRFTPILENVSQPKQGSRFGKATGLDYLSFFGDKKVTKILRAAVVNLKNLLVDGFKAAQSLRSSIANIVEQLKGFGGRAAKGFGLIGLVAAIVATIGALFGPQIKATYDWIVQKGGEIFEWIKGATKNIEELYETVRWMWGQFSGAISTITFGGVNIPGMPEFQNPFEPENDLDKEDIPSDVQGGFLGNISNMVGGMFKNMTPHMKGVADFFGLDKLMTPGNSGNNTGRIESSTNRGGGNTSESQQATAQLMSDEFQKQGLSPEGAKLATAEIGRENSLNRDLILGSHMDGPNRAYGAVSWQLGREKGLFDMVEAAGFSGDEAGLKAAGDEGVRINVRYMLQEMKERGNTELLNLLKKQNLTEAEKDKIRTLFKNKYFVYDPTIPIQRSRNWYERINDMNIRPAGQLQSSLPTGKTPGAPVVINAAPLLTASNAPSARPQQLINTGGSSESAQLAKFLSPTGEHTSSKSLAMSYYNVVT